VGDRKQPTPWDGSLKPFPPPAPPVKEKQMSYKHDLGLQVRDSITGFVGAITGRTDYISGCAQYLVQPRVDKDGKFVDAKWFDEDRLLPIPEVPVRVDVQRAGPDMPAPVK
jgi:hypothetical protein